MRSILGRPLRNISTRPPLRITAATRTRQIRGQFTHPAMTETQPMEPSDSKPQEEDAKLPKLSMADFRTYNHMAEHMEYFVRLSSS